MTTPQPLATPAAGWRISFADVLVAAGGLVVFLFSFAPFISAPSVKVLGQTIGGGSENAWYTTLSVFVVLAAILLIGTAAIDVLWPRHKEFVGLHRHHVQVGLALYVLIQMIGFAITDKGGASIGWGGIFMFLGALVAAAGAILNHFNMFQNTLAIPTGRPVVNSGGYVPPQGGSTPPPAPTPADPTISADPAAGS